jgi:hypothetical protein
MRKFLLAALAAASVTLPANAATVFSDNFESYPSNALNYAGFANFTVQGQVDVVGPVNPFGITVPSKVVDLDGTSGPGQLTTGTFAFNAGDYVEVSYDLSGSQRNGGNNDWYSGIDFLSGGTDFGDFGTLAANDPFATHTLSFTALAAGSFAFFVGTPSADLIGPLLDNVAIAITPGDAGVPEPANWAMLISGFGLVGGATRYRRRRTATILA